MTAISSIPEPVLIADRVHHKVLCQVAFSRHLNPLNAEEARRHFLQGAQAPPFRYRPLTEADEILRRLDAVDPPRDHPAGEMVGRCIDLTRLFTVALRDRTPEAFDALARAADWYPEPEVLALRFGPPDPDDQPIVVEAGLLIYRLRVELCRRGLSDWRIEEDPVMAARVLVDSAKRLLRVNPQAGFRERDLTRLVVHEIDVHVMRSHNGQAQALRCFETGLPGSLLTEEGLAMVAEERAGVSAPGVLARQLEVVRAIERARRVDFRTLYEELEERVGPGLAWGICLRIKRGLGDAAAPGVYAKDSVYLRGRIRVHRWLEAGGDLARLYVGKVGLDDPVDEWVAQGWVKPGVVPACWQ